MATATLVVTGDGLARFDKAVATLGSTGKAITAFSRAINRTGRTASNKAGRALAKQAGLPATTGKEAYRENVERASAARLAYTITGTGGEISLRHFKPRETRKGVSAAPWGNRTVFPGTFMKAGWWPKRKDMPHWKGQVFSRATSDGHSYNAAKSNPFVRAGFKKRERVGTKFNKEYSGVYIPVEMVRGNAAAAFLAAGPMLDARIAHEVRAITRGVITSKFAK